MREDLARKIAQHAGFVRLRQLLEDGVDALSSRITHRTQSVPSYSSRNRSREVGDDEAHSAATQPTHETPELASWLCLLTFRHAFLAQHLLEDVTELLITKALALVLCRSAAVVVRARSTAAKEGRPGETAGGRALLSLGSGDFLLRFTVIETSGVIVVGAGSIIFVTASRIAKGVVSIVDLLEVLGP